MYRLTMLGWAAVLLTIAPGSLRAGSNEYFPLTAGSLTQWVSESGGSPSATQLVVGETTYHGRQVWAIEVCCNSRLTEPATDYFSIAADGDVLYHGQRLVDAQTGTTHDLLYDPPLRYIEAPLVAGRSWTDTVERSVFEDGVLASTTPDYTRTAEVVEQDASISVPAGEFIALHLSHSETMLGGGLSRVETWFAAGIGAVHGERFHDGVRQGSSSLWEAPTPNESKSWGLLKAAFD